MIEDPVARWMLDEDVVCGNCVCWNGIRARDETGSCSRMGERHREQEPCRAWFGMTELGKGLYGRKPI